MILSDRCLTIDSDRPEMIGFVSDFQIIIICEYQSYHSENHELLTIVDHVTYKIKGVIELRRAITQIITKTRQHRFRLISHGLLSIGPSLN